MSVVGRKRPLGYPGVVDLLKGRYPTHCYRSAMCKEILNCVFVNLHFLVTQSGTLAASVKLYKIPSIV